MQLSEDLIRALLGYPTRAELVEVDETKEDFYDDFGNYIVNVHRMEDCSGTCTIHEHSEHALADKPLLWRNDRGIFEHICEHGVGHPCPDSLRDDPGVHGCCGCCYESR